MKYVTKADPGTIVEALLEQHPIDDSLERPAKNIISQAQQQDSWNPKDTGKLAVGAVYVAGRLYDVPIQYTDLADLEVDVGDECPADAVTYDSSTIQRAVSRLNEHLPLNVDFSKAATQLAKRYATELTFPEQHVEVAQSLAECCHAHDEFVGDSPSGLAAAAVYNVGRHFLSEPQQPKQYDVAEVSNVSEVTIRNHYVRQWEEFGEEIKAEFNK